MVKIGDYILGNILGVGAFGETYLAEKGNKKFAVKLIKEEAILQGFDINRFKRECRTLEKVQHKNIIKLIEYGQQKIGNSSRYYIVMEYLSGQDLEKYYKSISYQFEEKKLKEIIYQVIDGLEAMHSVKILHRDIKPQNIFLTDEGTIKLLDFGLVKMIDYTTLTMKGDGPKGTPLYIPPEAIRGEKLDSRSDFYSLGVMIYYIVTNGNFPFDAANILQLINMVLNQPPRPPKSFNKKISNEFENLILMMLSKQPFERNITHKDLKEAIRNTPIKLESQVKPIKKPVFKKEVWFRLLPNEKSKILQFLDNGGRINGIEYVANYLPRNRKTIAEILQRKTKFFFDPATNRLPYSTFSQTKGLVDLPYCWDKLNRLTHEDLRNISDIQKYVREVINWQASWNCDFFVAPFHFHRNLGDPWLELDLKLLQESVDYVKNNYSDIKIYAGICLNLEEYTSENNRIALLNEFSICTPDGFIFYGDEINETITNPARLYAYIELLRKFSVLGKKVIGARLGTLGLGILAAGADTVTTGIASLTGFSEKNLLQERSTGYNMEVKYYLPKLLLSLPSILVKDIIKVDVSLACNCEFCQGSPSLDSVAKIHYLNVRNNEVNEINSIRTNKEKLHWFADKIQNALAKCREVQKEIVELRPGYFSHLNTWLNVFGNYK